MVGWFKREYPDGFMWLALTSASLIAVLVTTGTAYHRLAIALLGSLIAWLLLIALFECGWWLTTAALRAAGIEIETKTAEPTGSRSGLRK